jgi:hypothetical protein
MKKSSPIDYEDLDRKDAKPNSKPFRIIKNNN